MLNRKISTFFTTREPQFGSVSNNHQSNTSSRTSFSIVGKSKSIKRDDWSKKTMNLRGVTVCPTSTSTMPHADLQTINTTSRSPSPIWLAPQVVTSCLWTGYRGPAWMNGDFHFKQNNGQLLRSKTRRLLLSCFFFLFFFWQRLEVSRSSTAADSGVFCLYFYALKWGLSEIPPVLVHMIQWESCVSVWGLFFSCLFMSHTGGKDPTPLTTGGLLLLIQRDNTLC